MNPLLFVHSYESLRIVLSDANASDRLFFGNRPHVLPTGEIKFKLSFDASRLVMAIFESGSRLLDPAHFKSGVLDVYLKNLTVDPTFFSGIVLLKEYWTIAPENLNDDPTDFEVVSEVLRVLKNYLEVFKQVYEFFKRNILGN